MAVHSIHTDPGTLQGLQFLNRSNRSLFEAQNRIGTGSRIYSPAVDGAAFGGGGTVSAGDAAAALRSNSAFSQFADRVGSALNAFGGDARRIGSQIKFNTTQQATTQEGVGAIRDADLARESVNLAKDRIRQQLGAISLGITNRSRESVIGMFLNR